MWLRWHQVPEMAEFCSICGLPVHRYSLDHLGTPDDLMGCVNSLRGALEVVEAERDRWRLKARREYNQAIDLGNAVTANAGEAWDGDESLDYIAVQYVRWLEAERRRLSNARLLP